jgi:hypothetical protein
MSVLSLRVPGPWVNGALQCEICLRFSRPRVLSQRHRDSNRHGLRGREVAGGRDMSAQEKVKIRCPACHGAYHVPQTLVGHRARCPKCKTVFRVSAASASRPDGSPAPVPPSSSETPPRRKSAPPPYPSDNHRSRPSRGSGDRASHRVTEDDILRWLSESDDDDDLPPEPRRWVSPPAPVEEAPAQNEHAHPV